MRVQIYTAQTPDEAVALASLGVDHVGITPSTIGLPGEVDLATARRIRDALVGRARSVALSVSTEIEEITKMADTVGADILHLCGPTGALTPSDLTHIRAWLGSTAIMQAVAVTGPSAIDVARSFQTSVDYLILDSVTPGIPGVGAAGSVHDWDVSAAIVEAVDVPVILAGGLSPSNVSQAIERVRPWGVDSLTHTNLPFATGGFRKDLRLVEAFVEAARAGTR